jgi:hypothetical protein
VQCKGCSNCTSSDWVDNVVDNYQFKIIRSCNCESCAVSFEYRCMTGYFGTNQTCISCATATGNSAATSTSGSNALITDCFLNSGYSDSDASGSWTYTSDCHYKE